MKIFVLGGASVDTIIHVDTQPPLSPSTLFASSTRVRVGSTGVGKAIPLSLLGFDVTFHALIGSDAEGDMIQDYLNQFPLRFLYDIDPSGTETHTNLMYSNGERTSIYTNTSSVSPHIDEDRIKKMIDETDIVCLNINPYTKRFISYIKSTKKPLWIDIHDYDGLNPYHHEFIKASDFLFMSSEQMNDAFPFMRKQIDRHKKMVCVTHGSQGSTCMDADKKIYKQNVLQTSNILDTNGAGDHYFAGFLYGFYLHKTIQDCMIYASILGKLAIESNEISNPLISIKYLEEMKNSYLERKEAKWDKNIN